MHLVTRGRLVLKEDCFTSAAILLVAAGDRQWVPAVWAGDAAGTDGGRWSITTHSGGPVEEEGTAEGGGGAGGPEGEIGPMNRD